MTEIRYVSIDGISYPVVLSDETEALLKAKADGKASVGFWDRNGEGQQDLSGASYLVEDLEDADQKFLEQVIRRHLGLPWKITETRRLLIREFAEEDADQVPKEAEDGPADEIFYTREKLKDYIRCQYGFYEWGIWALVEKETGQLVGKAGLTPIENEHFDGISMELGYHIFKPYRRKGLAVEACRGIISHVKETLEEPVFLYAKIDASNEASIHVIQKLGFALIEPECSGEVPEHDPSAWYLPEY